MRRACAFFLVLLGLTSVGCRRGLPDAESYGARLYASRCSGCHAVYNPGSLTASMWEVQVQAMEPRMREAGLPTLTHDERRAILDYLQQHAER